MRRSSLFVRNEDSLNKIADEYGIAKRFTDYEKLLEDPQIDAVHKIRPFRTMPRQPCRVCRQGNMWHVQCHGHIRGRLKRLFSCPPKAA